MESLNKLQELSLYNLRVNDGFWQHRIETNKKVTLKHQYKQLEKTGRLKNFNIAAGKSDGEFNGMFFNDSDVYKWIEAASHTLIQQPDQRLAERVKEIVAVVAEAQENDGYLNTYFTLVEPDKKWTNLGMMHELYCAGHLFEAAVAHYRATNDRKLLDVAIRFADLIDNTFRINNVKGIPGHEEIELGLVELYRVTSNKRYLKLAKFFIDKRGQNDSPFSEELKSLEERAGFNFKEQVENFDTLEVDRFYRSFFLDDNGKYDGSYAQDHLPVRDQKTVDGHAVRAMYLYSGMADIAEETNDQELIKTLDCLWNNMTEKRLYITGGIGSSHDIEGFGSDYELPNETAYAETCAAVGNILWNHRMLKLTGEAKYADLIEKVLFNGFLSGVSLEGNSFFYVNPLKSSGDHHRKGWFNVSCCPPNIARLLASIQKYIYLKQGDTLYINQYIGSEVEFKLSNDSKVILKQTNDYPWKGNVKVSLFPEKESDFTINLRLPGWANQYNIKVNGKDVDVGINSKGYLEMKRKWSINDTIELNMPMRVEKIYANPAVAENVSRFAFQRGPVVYCLESVDNDCPLEQIIIKPSSRIESHFEKDLLNGVEVIEGEAVIPDKKNWGNQLYIKNNISYIPIRFRAVPYHTWDHREPGKMLVWIRTGL